MRWRKALTHHCDPGSFPSSYASVLAGRPNKPNSQCVSVQIGYEAGEGSCPCHCTVTPLVGHGTWVEKSGWNSMILYAPEGTISVARAHASQVLNQSSHRLKWTSSHSFDKFEFSVQSMFTSSFFFLELQKLQISYSLAKYMSFYLSMVECNNAHLLKYFT